MDKNCRGEIYRKMFNVFLASTSAEHEPPHLHDFDESKHRFYMERFGIDLNMRDMDKNHLEIVNEDKFTLFLLTVV